MSWMGTNATGWAELYDGHMINAVFTMFDTALGGWTIAILFFVYQMMLLIKTINPILSFVTGIIFTSIYIGSSIIKPISSQVMIVIMIIELGGIMYLVFFK